MAMSAKPEAVNGNGAGKCGRCGGLLVGDWDVHLGNFLKCAVCGLEDFTPAADAHLIVEEGSHRGDERPPRPPRPFRRPTLEEQRLAEKSAVLDAEPTAETIAVRLERAERQLQLADDDFVRLRIAQAARAMAAAARVLAMPGIQLRAVRLQRRAEREFAIHNPKMTPQEIGYHGGNGIKGPELPGISKGTAHTFRSVNGGISDADFDDWLSRAKRAEDLTRANQRRFAQELRGTEPEPPPGMVGCWAQISRPIYTALRMGRELPSTATCKCGRVGVRIEWNITPPRLAEGAAGAGNAGAD